MSPKLSVASDLSESSRQTVPQARSCDSETSATEDGSSPLVYYSNTNLKPTVVKIDIKARYSLPVSTARGHGFQFLTPVSTDAAHGHGYCVH